MFSTAIPPSLQQAYALPASTRQVHSQDVYFSGNSFNPPPSPPSRFDFQDYKDAPTVRVEYKDGKFADIILGTDLFSVEEVKQAFSQVKSKFFNKKGREMADLPSQNDDFKLYLISYKSDNGKEDRVEFGYTSTSLADGVEVKPLYHSYPWRPFRKAGIFLKAKDMTQENQKHLAGTIWNTMPYIDRAIRQE